MTLDEWLRQGTAQLAAGPHPERARRDAEALLLHHISRNRAWMLAHGNEEFGSCSALGYAALLDRRQRGEPIQYIIGETEFYGLSFKVTPAVLIPRPETEHSVEKIIELCRAIENPRIVDVGTGSGAIAVTLAHTLQQAQVTATDFSAEALVIAKQNAEKNNASDRVRFLEGDLLAPVRGEHFEIVVSNPPYISTDDRGTLDVEVRNHEPHTALFAGPDGLAIYRRLIPQALQVLVPGGHIVLEIGYDQRDAVHDLLAASGYTNVEFVPDLQGIARVAVGQHP
ncbi:peptide chain release factor N(5)-glutamine methyltransferase [Occallatibacter riparius]|uniref:Release factor glutamine methyltransferase n=1 Tax=Occallatibacter riparius TaxID=1002689 RepID=A0A9J7BSW7_9BACT|nr:peptide chain release factor N(5)-glutamine methyltransferase [Occallatibacter riparius]UWZ85703.1 peptide chain release factor N(5)-glutamine methyltransferase [Occallatibacter riparius]